MKFIKRHWLSLTLTVLTVTFAVLFITQSVARAEYERRLSEGYRQTFSQLHSDMSTLSYKLRRLTASASPAGHIESLQNISRTTGEIISAMESLPLSVADTHDFTSFANRLADYCSQLSDRVSHGGGIEEADYAVLDELTAAMDSAAAKLDEQWNSGYTASLDYTSEQFYSDEGGDISLPTEDYPRLTYDGPFSESTENKQPQGLTGSDINEAGAVEVCRKLIGNGRVSSAGVTGETGGKIPCWVVEGSSSYGDFSLEVTKQGGHVLRLVMGSEETGSAVPTDERYDALCRLGAEFLQQHGWGECEPTYAQFYAGCALINYTPVENGVALYPDLIKLWIRVSDENIVGIDAYNYLMSHKVRGRLTPALSQEDAAAAVSPRITVTSSRPVLIPMPDNTERLCWEFSATAGGYDYLVYIDAATGTEEDVLSIIHTNEGTLTL